MTYVKRFLAPALLASNWFCWLMIGGTRVSKDESCLPDNYLQHTFYLEVSRTFGLGIH